MEALLSIYEGDLTVIESEPHHVMTIPIKTMQEDIPDENKPFVLLKMSYSEKYPDDLLNLEVEEQDNITESDIEEMMEHLRQQMEECRGTVMAFTVISAAIEWLEEKWIIWQQEKEDREKHTKSLEEAAEMKKIEGTKVTIESFLAWKTKFDAETIGTRTKIDTKQNKLTGKALFLSNAAMNESDISFLDEDDESVEVDESLFEDLDDLSLN